MTIGFPHDISFPRLQSIVVNEKSSGFEPKNPLTTKVCDFFSRVLKISNFNPTQYVEIKNHVKNLFLEELRAILEEFAAMTHHHLLSDETVMACSNALEIIFLEIESKLLNATDHEIKNTYDFFCKFYEKYEQYFRSFFNENLIEIHIGEVKYSRILLLYNFIHSFPALLQKNFLRF